MIDEMTNPLRHFQLRRTLRARYYAARSEFQTATYLLTRQRRMNVDPFDAWCAFNLARNTLDQARAEYLETSGVVEITPCATTVRVEAVAKVLPLRRK